ncbi:MAG: radical SAM protein [Pseudomonadota bacterium]
MNSIYLWTIRHTLRIARWLAGDRLSLPHLLAFLRYNSITKFYNLLKVFIDARRGRLLPNSKPFILFLEVNNICNLHCPFCLTGKGKSADRQRRNMPLEEMKRALSGFEKYLYFIQLYNWGEPFLNPDIFEFISHAHRQRIFTMASSNMNFTLPNVPEQIVTSGLDYFIAAIDGFSQESYSQYRRGGNFEKAKLNLEKILEIRRNTKSSNPIIEWQYVVFRHNQADLEHAERFAQEIGVDYFHPIPGYIEDPAWITTLPEFKVDLGRPESVLKCRRPWTHMNIRADGGAAPCCYEYYKRDDFGNILNEPFSTIWHNDYYTTARNILSNGLEKAPGAPVTICHRCVSKGVRPSFE